MSTDKNERAKLIKALLTIVLALVLSFFGINIFDNIPKLELTMIDVEQGDSFLLVQNGVVALVDCGTPSTGVNVVNYLNEQGITKIDYLFGTHPHDDHMGGMEDVINAFEIGKVILPDVLEEHATATWYERLINLILEKDLDVEFAEVGNVYALGNAKIKVIGPFEQPKSDKNDYSIVLKVTFGEMDVIMTGDATTKVEADILKSGENIDAEILKVGHHGSHTSSSVKFLDAVSPEYALISAGVGNKYLHPIESTMKKLSERNIDVYRTDECGTVVVTITSDNISFNTKKGDYLSGEEIERRVSK